ILSHDCHVLAAAHLHRNGGETNAVSFFSALHRVTAVSARANQRGDRCSLAGGQMWTRSSDDRSRTREEDDVPIAVAKIEKDAPAGPDVVVGLIGERPD